MHSFHLFFRLLGISLKSQMQYRASFLMLTITHFLSTFVDIFGIWILFSRFKYLQGWTFPEIALIYGIIHMGFATSEAIARGFDTFSQMIRHGEFDRILLRPLGTIFQIATKDIQMMRIGRFFQGFVVLLWGMYQLKISLFSLDTFIMMLAVLGTTALFYGLFVIQAALSFWTTETLELMNITTYGGVETGQYPITIYPTSFQFIFTFIIPLSLVAYYPIATLLNHQSFPLGWGILFPLSGVVFLFLAFQFWKIGVQHYQSTGS